jgi:lysophospholipase L1-like esterase
MRLWSSFAEDIQSDQVVNLAFGGSTLEACAWFYERIVLPVKPRSLLLYAGDNDLGDGKSPAQVVDYYKRFIGKTDIYFPGLPVAFISIKPSVARFGIIGRIAEANAAIKKLVEARPNSRYIDLFPALLTESGKPDATYYQPDGLHLSDAGYRVWTSVLMQHRDFILNLDRHDDGR